MLGGPTWTGVAACTTPCRALAVCEHSSSNESGEACPTAGDYRPGDVVGGKYEVVDIMGRGSNGVTYKALDPDGRAVAVKALSLRSMTGGWKQLELFEREAHVLEGLKHPGVAQGINATRLLQSPQYDGGDGCGVVDSCCTGP